MIPTNCPLGSNWSTTIYIMKRANIHPQSNITLEMPQIQESGAFCPILQRPSSYVFIVTLLPSFIFSKLGMSFFWLRIFLEKFVSQDHFRLTEYASLETHYICLELFSGLPETGTMWISVDWLLSPVVLHTFPVPTPVIYHLDI